MNVDIYVLFEILDMLHIKSEHFILKGIHSKNRIAVQGLFTNYVIQVGGGRG